MPDPITLVTTAIERAFIDSAILRSLMGPTIEKRVDFYLAHRGTKQPDTYSETDLPMVYGLGSAGLAESNLASNLATLDVTYEIGIISGDKRFSKELYPLLFGVIATAVAVSQDQSFRAITWQDYRIVRDLRLGAVQSNFSQNSQSPGIAGTFATCALTAYLNLPHSKLLAHHAQT